MKHEAVLAPQWAAAFGHRLWRDLQLGGALRQMTNLRNLKP
jgi:hypothetical protein